MSRFSLFGLPVSIVLLWGLIFAGSLVLPSTNVGVFASPDETAVAVSLQRIQATGSAAVAEFLAESAPWVHPRSYVAEGQSLVPVGFLGWPWVLAQLHRLFSLSVTVWLASLVAVSGCIPWYLLLRKRFGLAAAWWGTLLTWTFPAVLLYANRSLFSHLPQYSFVLWALWLLVGVFQKQSQSSSRRALTQLAAGALFGMGLAFRPLEAAWLIPIGLVVWSQFGAIAWRKQVLVGVGVCIGFIPLFVAQAHTYGSWFQIGYWIQANADPNAIVIPQLATSVARPWYLAIAPYGLHPRSIFWNVRSFVFGFLWPWAAAAVVVGAYLMRVVWFSLSRQKLLEHIRRARFFVPIVVIAGMFGWLLLIYGSGIYADHVRPGAVTVGNSFLRYTLPFGFFLAWILAALRSRLEKKPPQWRLVFAAFALGLAVFGVYSAFARDEEGILATRRELIRYSAVRSAAQAAFQPQDIFLSDRSDKIFFPAFRAVSPMPSRDQLSHLTLTSSTALGLFSRPLSFSERDAWRQLGYDVRELQTFDREHLYRLTPFPR